MVLVSCQAAANPMRIVAALNRALQALVCPYHLLSVRGMTTAVTDSNVNLASAFQGMAAPLTVIAPTGRHAIEVSVFPVNQNV